METMIINILLATWNLFLDSSVFILGGLLFSGILRALISPEMISTHLGKGRFLSVFKSALFGIPIPLCSCGVLPAAISLKKQGANNGATAAFLISTPESGVDSISVSWALLDPILTVARPIAAFTMALSAGITENLFNWPKKKSEKAPVFQMSQSCCGEESHSGHSHDETKGDSREPVLKRLSNGLIYSFTDVWKDIFGWFFIGLLIAGVITTLIPDDLAGKYLGGGLLSMLIMLMMGIPIYICATASTPVAAAFIMMGVSPGAALVFLLAGPATNVTSLTVLTGILGKKTTGIYLGTIAIFSVAFGLILDKLYIFLDISPQAVVGSASEMVPLGLQLAGGIILIVISIKPLYEKMSEKLPKMVSASNSEGLLTGDKKSAETCAGGG